MTFFNPNESNQNAEGACVERLSQQAALKAARRQAEPIPKAFSPKKYSLSVMIQIFPSWGTLYKHKKRVVFTIPIIYRIA